MLAKEWDTTKKDPTGYWMSEKYDGIRAIWTGKELVSRSGNLFYPPTFWTHNLPTSIQLDGELYIDKNMFQSTLSIVRSHHKSEKWHKIRFVVFDTISDDELFEDRLVHIPTDHPFIDIVHHEMCTGREHLDTFFNKILSTGGEGVMLRANMSKYEHGRSSLLYKLKQFLDEDAIVVGYVDGKGKLTGKVGSIVVRGRQCTDTFRIGTGLSDYDREIPPPIGSIVTYKYQELTKSGKPRFPVFIRMKQQLE